jgi:hypothetical protein
MAGGHTVLACKTFDAFGNHIAILKPNYENPADMSFTCFHDQPPRFLSMGS